jgi:hypothetical protein
MVGYSGGAIATGWAAQLQPTYAPELAFVGAVAGGTPADFGLLTRTMNKTWGSGRSNERCVHGRHERSDLDGDRDVQRVLGHCPRRLSHFRQGQRTRRY